MHLKGCRLEQYFKRQCEARVGVAIDYILYIALLTDVLNFMNCEVKTNASSIKEYDLTEGCYQE